MEPTSTILIVDDDRDIRTLLADYLESNGYRALCAPDGVAMWKTLDEARPDLVVLEPGASYRASWTIADL